MNTSVRVTTTSSEAPERGGLTLMWARLFVHALADAGITHAVVSPGSRSTPLTLALAEQRRIACDVVVDERCAGFFALGISRANGTPTLLVCTSGTAGAHYFPAIIEASASHTPLVVVTADRPWELQDAGALQTIDQTKLFGTHVRHAIELGAPDPSVTSMRAAMRVAALAVSRSVGPVPGPVHVNARFRKPLEPTTDDGPLHAWEEHARALLASGAPRVLRDAPNTAELARAVANELRGQRGLIVCGPTPAHGDPSAKREAAISLAHATGYALVSESTSQVRFGADVAGITTIAEVDTLFAELATEGEHAPRIILQLGETPTSASYARYLSHAASLPEPNRLRRIVISPHTWADPEGDAALVVFADVWALATNIAEVLEGVPVSASTSWIADTARRCAKASATRADVGAAPFDEATVARVMVETLSAMTPSATTHATLMVSNSRNIRAIDTFSAHAAHPIRVLHQRGVSGIDGLISGTAGARRALAGPMALMIGDLGALHDIGGLAAARSVGGPLAIVIVNNRGGQIFSDLPVANTVDPETLRRFFITPSPVDFESAARAFGLSYVRVETARQLEAALANAMPNALPYVIEATMQEPAPASRPQPRPRSGGINS